VSSVAVSGSTVVLTLASPAVESGQSVSVAYTQPAGSNAVKDANGNKASSLSSTSVTNNSTVDTTGPTFVSAATNTAGTTVTLTYSETLGGTMAPRGAFEVTVGGVSCSLTNASRSGSTVVLTLAACSIESGQEVTVAYTDPSVSNDSTAVQDAAGNDAATLAATSVTNNSTVDATSPTFVSAATNTAGTTITLTYSEALSTTTAAGSDFTVLVGGVSRSVSGVAVSGSTVVLTLASPAVESGQSVSVAYTQPAGSNAVKDSNGNKADSLSATSVTNNSTVDVSAPSFVSATTNSGGTTVTLTYSEALSATTASSSAFTVLVDGVSRSVSGVAVSGSTVVLTLSAPVASGQSVSVSYSDPTGGNDANAVQDAAGNDVATLASQTVTNNVASGSNSGSSGGTTTTSSTSTSSTTTSTIPSGTTTSTTVNRPPTTTTTVKRRPTTTLPRVSTTTSALAPTTTRQIPVSTSTTLVVASTRPVSTTIRSTSTTSTVVPTSTSTVALSSVTSVAAKSVEDLQRAAQKLTSIQAQSTALTTELRAAQLAVGEANLGVLDPKSALVVAVVEATNTVERLRASNSSPSEIAAAVERRENLLIAIAQNVTISISRIADAEASLAAILADPTATSLEIAAAKATLVAARIPSVEVVAAVLDAAQAVNYLDPVIVSGVVDSPGAGRIVLLDGSTAKQIQIARINRTAIRMTSPDGFTLTISTRDKNGVPLEFNSRGGIVVKHGNFISIGGEGFAPGTEAKTWLFSSPRELGRLSVSNDGSFAADFAITDDIAVGNHVAQVNGLSPDGEIRSLSLDVEIRANEGPAPFDPIANRRAVAALIAEALTLLALARTRPDEEDREQADVSEVGVDRIGGDATARRDRLSPPAVRMIDQVFSTLPQRLAATQQLLARVVLDGAYLRSLAGIGATILPLVAIPIGVLAAHSAGFDAVSPSFAWLVALLILGTLDAFAGGLAALAVIAATVIAGGVTSTDAIRGMLGLAVFSFAVPLVASTTRPFRRSTAVRHGRAWTRLSDFTLLTLFGAWAAGAMYSALPGLYGVTSEASGKTTTIQLIAVGALLVRSALEVLAASFTPIRLTALVGQPLVEPSTGRTIGALAIRTALFAFVAVAFIGNNVFLWLGTLFYVTPRLVALVAESFPKSSTLARWVPSGLLRTVIMLFVARWWGSQIGRLNDDPAMQLQIAFVLLSVPSLVLTILGWFAAGKPSWKSTPVSKVLGVVVLGVGFLTVTGFLFA
ncbi:MAG: hypothetical protein RLZZ16_755, partial [Actinomycetota bacterium]